MQPEPSNDMMAAFLAKSTEKQNTEVEKPKEEEKQVEDAPVIDAQEVEPATSN